MPLILVVLLHYQVDTIRMQERNAINHGYYGWYWTLTALDSQYAISRRFVYDETGSYVHNTEKYDGVSVRCLKNE